MADSVQDVEEGPADARGHPLQEARCLSVDLARGRAEAEGVMRDLDGRVVGRLRVGYHVLPWRGFMALFADHQRPTEDERWAVGADRDASPYAVAPERPAGRWDGERFTRTLSPVAAADCAGHFAGLPAAPVSILGRHVLMAVLDGMAAAGVPTRGARVRRAELTTERFAWAGEVLELVASPRESDPEGAWSCEIRVPAAGATVARFSLEIDAPRRAARFVSEGSRRASVGEPASAV